MPLMMLQYCGSLGNHQGLVRVGSHNEPWTQFLALPDGVEVSRVHKIKPSIYVASHLFVLADDRLGFFD